MSIFEEKLSVVIPAYNEGERIYENLMEMDRMIGTFSNQYELIVVNDGSLDNTEQEIARASATNGHIISAGYKENKGKGGAIRAGVERATGAYIAFLDADLDLSPMHLEKFMQRMEEKNATAVIGSKLHRDSEVDYPLPRRIISLCYYLMLKIMFRLKIKDTQTGVKLFRAESLKQVMGYVTSNGFAYDIEMLTLLNVFGGKIEEMPIRLVFQRENKWGRIRWSDITNVAAETVHIYQNVHKVKKMRDKLEVAK
ncbi:MAG: glycosyltransferase [Suilimivivens sp.]